MLSAGRRACHRVCWGSAGECSCGAPVVARHLPARVWRADARGLITPSCHRKKTSAGSTRPTQSPSQTPQGGNTTGGKQHRGETAHGETHPPTTWIRPLAALVLRYTFGTAHTEPGGNASTLTMGYVRCGAAGCPNLDRFRHGHFPQQPRVPDSPQQHQHRRLVPSKIPPGENNKVQNGASFDRTGSLPAAQGDPMELP